MKYKQSIQTAIDYIEENLKNDLNNVQIAESAGYSEYHFLRIFRECVGLTPADYIRKRRISEIVRCMEEDDRPISDIAFEYGFNSKENFTRAFKMEHHILPTEFRTYKNSLKLYDKRVFELPDFEVSCTLEQLCSFELVVLKSDEEVPPLFWNKYNVKGYSKRLSGGRAVVDYGVSDWRMETASLDYYIGIKRSEALGDLRGTQVMEIQGGLYAVFHTPLASHFDFVNNIHKTWNYINTVWLPDSGYQRTGGYEFECYLEESRKYSETIYIPIQKYR